MQLFLIALELKIQQEKLVKNLSPIKRLDVSKSGPGVYIERQIDIDAISKILFAAIFDQKGLANLPNAIDWQDFIFAFLTFK